MPVLQSALKPRSTAHYGWRPQLPDARDRQYSAAMPRVRFLPQSIDLRPHMTPPYDQGALGSCTGNGVGRCWQFALQAEGKPAPMPARLFVYFFERLIEGTISQDSGAQIRDGLKVLGRYGCCDERLWPYDIGRFRQAPSNAARADASAHPATQYLAVQQNASEIKTCLSEGFPLVFGFTVYESFESDAVAASGVVNLPGPNESIVGGHCVVIAGYDDATQRFLCCNSWGTDWGQHGYFTIPYAYVLSPKLASDFWTVRAVK